MASVPSSSPSSDSQNSATHPIQHKDEVKVEDVPGNNGVFDSHGKKPQIVPAHFQVLDSVEYNEKYEKYEADYTHRLLGKYFSKKNVYGGNIFDKKMTIDDETIMSSRWPSTQSFADPVQCFEDLSSISVSSSAEGTPNGKLEPNNNS